MTLSKKERTLRWALLTALLVVLLAVCAVLVAVASWQGLDEPVMEEAFPLKERWRFKTNDGIVTEPSVGGDRVVIRTNKQLYALDVRTGTLLWTAPVHSDVSPTPPLVEDSLVVVGSESGVKTLDAETGQVVWESSDVCGGLGAIPAAINETMVYIVRYGCHVRAYDRATGAVVWEIDLPARSSADLFLDQDKIYVVVGDTLLMLDSATGSLIEGVTGQIGVPATYRSGVLYGFVEEKDDSDRLVAFDTQTKKTLWVGPEINISYPIGPPLISGTRVLVATSSGRPTAVDVHTGKTLWVAQVGSDMYQTPAVLNDIVYILGIGDGKIYALSIQSGVELGHLFTGDKFVITGYSYNWRPVTAEGLLIVPLGRRVFAYGE